MPHTVCRSCTAVLCFNAGKCTTTGGASRNVLLEHATGPLCAYRHGSLTNAHHLERQNLRQAAPVITIGSARGQ